MDKAFLLLGFDGSFFFRIRNVSFFWFRSRFSVSCFEIFTYYRFMDLTLFRSGFDFWEGWFFRMSFRCFMDKSFFCRSFLICFRCLWSRLISGRRLFMSLISERLSIVFLLMFIFRVCLFFCILSYRFFSNL